MRKAMHRAAQHPPIVMTSLEKKGVEEIFYSFGCAFL
jgi:hypothetical protein